MTRANTIQLDAQGQSPGREQMTARRPDKGLQEAYQPQTQIHSAEESLLDALAGAPGNASDDPPPSPPNKNMF